MLSNVLNSAKAINMSIQIIRVFDELRKYTLEQTPKDMRIEEIHKLLMLHIENSDYKFSGYDKAIEQIILALNNLIEQTICSYRATLRTIFSTSPGLLCRATPGIWTSQGKRTTAMGGLRTIVWPFTGSPSRKSMSFSAE